MSGIIENIVSHIQKILEGQAEVIKLPKATTGKYTIRVKQKDSNSYCEWDFKRSVHRNKVLKELQKIAPQLTFHLD